jgi:nicotinate-nucleotide pyrophosphorylase (carboxylating)
VEVETLAQLEEAIRARADIVMLDNFDVARTRDAVDLAQGRVVLESSGGINVESITEYAEAGVDYISVGNLTKQIEPLDLSMRFV